MDNLFEVRLFFFFFFLLIICSSSSVLASDWSKGNSTETTERPEEVIVDQQNSNAMDDPSRTVREAADSNAGNATTDAPSVGNGTAEDAMSTTIDWWSSLATQSPLVAQRDSANASASNSSVAAPSSSAPPNSTSSSSPDNSTAAAKNDAISRPLQLFNVFVAVGTMAATIL